jgi:glycosyltransferase involved in cell wall biosynthesis
MLSDQVGQKMVRNRIAYIRVYGGPPIARSVEDLLIRSFPEYEVDTLTLTKLLKQRPDILILNSLATMRQYGGQIVKGERVFRRAFMVTPYLFRRVRELVRGHFAGRHEEYAFSFQLQSLFDTSTPFFPHFVYTDHTNLTNLTYSEIEGAHIHSASWLALEEEVYRNAEHIFTRSSNITESLVTQYNVPEKKVTTAYVGVNAPAATGSVSNNAFHNQNILFVGTDWERKGGPELVEAFAAIQQEFPEAQLTIVGCRPDIEVANCEVVGQVPVDQISKYYQAASVFCLPTRREPFGVVFVEALAHKLPLIGTDLGAIPDFIVPGKSGYLVPANDVTALAEALRAILKDPVASQEMGEYGYKLAQERYNWSTVGKIMRQVIVPALDSPMPEKEMATL